MRDRGSGIRPPALPGGTAQPGATEPLRQILERTSDSMRRLNLAVLDASIMLMRAPDGEAAAAARSLAIAAAKSSAVAIRLPDCLEQAGALAKVARATRDMSQ